MLRRARVGAAVAVGVVLVGAACGDGRGPGAAGGVEVERVALDAPLAGELVAVGDVLVAGAPGDEGSLGPAGVQVSADGGRSWEPAELPGAPDRLDVDFGRPLVVDGVAVVTGRELTEQMDVEVPGGAAYVWTSADGVTWHGGELAGSGPAFASVDVVGVDGLLLAGFTTGPPGIMATGTFALWWSTDGGARWQPAEVPALALSPGQTAGLENAWRLEDGRLALAASALGGTGPTVSSDPDGSVSGPSGAGSPPSSSGPARGGSSPSTVPAESDGSVSDPSSAGAAGPAAPDGGPTVLVSGDGGATWNTARCAVGDVDGSVCAPPERAGDLLYRRSGVSVDGGRTWRPMAITPPAEPDSEAPRIDGVVETPGGGWLAAASLYVPSDVSYGFLLHSTDGVRWRQLLHPDPCRADDIGRPNSSVSVPVRLGDGWLVAYSCLALSTPVLAELFVLPDGGEAEPRSIAGSRRDDVAYGDPVALGDTIVVPERDEGGSAIVALSLVTP